MKKAVLSCIILFGSIPCHGRIITVDNDGPADFNTIQAAINDANDGDSVLVMPGLYQEAISFSGKDITVTSAEPTNWSCVSTTVIYYDDHPSPGGPAVLFKGTEQSSCMLAGFTIYGYIQGKDWQSYPVDDANTHATITYCKIQNCYGDCGTVISRCDGLISNCLITDNNHVFCVCICHTIEECKGVIRNCTIANNRHSGIWFGDGGPVLENCIIVEYLSWNAELPAPKISFTNIYSPHQQYDANFLASLGPGNISVDPCFVPSQEIGVGSCHLRSAGWRWSQPGGYWTWDDVTSRCIDAGNPASPLGAEPMTVPRDPNSIYGTNVRIDMGVYGGTAQASIPPHQWTLLADITNDRKVDFNDLAFLAIDWQSGDEEHPGDFDRNSIVNLNDFALFVEDWLEETIWQEN
ncbi:MAG: right-handed parallel beta-helix repeat-containing protein [Sedimentisphaerales bacterium]|nr:right-handed parallel beta-helix repeat-containing protein [Sedimentisphaerales bacterium]